MALLLLPQLWACEKDFGSLRRSWETVVTDFDGDGHADIVVEAPGGYFLLRGPRFDDPLLIIEEDDRGRSRFVVGDVNDDGWPDVVYWGRGPRVILGSPEPPFVEHQIRFAKTCGRLVGLADVNGDGHVDIICTGPSEDTGAARIDVKFALGDARFREPELLATHEACSWVSNDALVLAGADDGSVDVLFGCSDREVALMRGDGRGGMRPAWAHGRGPVVAVGTGNFDGDAHVDVAAVLQCEDAHAGCREGARGKLHIRLGDEAGDVGPAQDYDTGRMPVDLAIGDLDGDGIDEVVVANASTSELSILRRGHVTVYPILRPATAVSLGDIDQDGDLDIVVSVSGFDGPYSFAIGTIENDGHGNLSTDTYYELPSWP